MKFIRALTRTEKLLLMFLAVIKFQGTLDRTKDIDLSLFMALMFTIIFTFIVIAVKSVYKYEDE